MVDGFKPKEGAQNGAMLEASDGNSAKVEQETIKASTGGPSSISTEENINPAPASGMTPQGWWNLRILRMYVAWRELNQELYGIGMGSDEAVRPTCQLFDRSRSAADTETLALTSRGKPYLKDDEEQDPNIQDEYPWLDSEDYKVDCVFSDSEIVLRSFSSAV